MIGGGLRGLGVVILALSAYAALVWLAGQVMVGRL